MIEWLRWTLFLTSALVGVNLIGMFYALSINIPFGVITCLIAILTRYSENGSACAVEGMQATRAFYLSLQVVCLIVYLVTCFGNILYMRLRGVDWCHEMYLLEEEEDD